LALRDFQTELSAYVSPKTGPSSYPFRSPKDYLLFSISIWVDIYYNRLQKEDGKEKVKEVTPQSQPKEVKAAA